VGLLGFNVVWASIGLGRPSPAIGLLIAGLLVTGMAYAYLRWLREPEPAHPRLWASSACVRRPSRPTAKTSLITP
jgi:hypothetical protein